MKKIINILMLAVVTVFTACSNNDFDTEQFTAGVALNSFGPCPVARGGELRFIGSGMDQITKITLPGSDDITDIQRISDNEIRITVPQDAEEGFVVLHYSGGTISTKTKVTYSEPISVDGFEPAIIKPGNELTIKGEYLNLMHQVCFSFIEGGDSVNVSEDDFIEHTRNAIRVIVPEEAVSGCVIVSDGKELPNIAKSKDELGVILPSVDAPLDLTDAKPGSLITIPGHDLDLVRTVLTPDGNELAFKYKAESAEITFTLPGDITDGTIVAVPASGVKVAIANIGVVVPTELVATPATELRPGTVISIKGVNIDQVATITFPNVADPVKPVSVTATELKVLFPAAAQSGNAALNLHSGKSVEIALETAKPVAELLTPNPVAAAAPLTIQGRNLDLVTKVTFAGGVDVEVSVSDPTTFDIIAPVTASSGALTLTMANGETAVTPSLTINAPECAYITEVLTEELLAGELMMAKIANEDKLTGVLVNGEAVQYINNNGTLYISLPSTCGNGTVVTLVSSNGEISYTYDITAATHVEIMAYNDGPRDLGSWNGEADGGAFRIYKDVFEGVPAGAKLVFHVASYAFAQIQINDANWSQLTILQPSQDQTRVEFELTADVLNTVTTVADGWSETAMVVQGEGTVVNKVTIEYERSLAQTIWEGSWECSGWNGNQDLAWGGFDWSACKPGQTLTFYLTPTVAAGAWWCVSLRHGDSWGALVDVPSQFDTPEGGILNVTMTADMIADLINYNGLVITGDGYILNKITLE